MKKKVEDISLIWCSDIEEGERRGDDVLIIKDETVFINSSELYKQLRDNEGIRDFTRRWQIIDSRQYQYKFVNCDLYVRMTLPNSVI